MEKLTAGIDLSSEEAFLASLDLVEWPCPSCGEPVSAPKNRRVAERRCMNCSTGAAKGLSRETMLTVAGVPVRYRRPFIEREWPIVARPVGRKWERVPGEEGGWVQASAWRGKPWALGFIGDSWAGKTMLATEVFARALAKMAERGPISARWTAASALADSGFGTGGDRELYRQAERVRLLLIDDLGWGAGIEKLFALVSARHANELPTIWTANMTMKDFVESIIGQPLVSRLGDDGWVCKVSGRWSA